MFPLAAPESLSLFRKTITLGSVDGLLCFYGGIETEMAIIWNPTVRKSVGIVIPWPKSGSIVVGFGVCPDTSDPKLVKITIDRKSSMWVVEVFTLSTRVWKTVYTGAPFKLCDLMTLFQAFVNGVIYFRGTDYDFDNQLVSYFIISYDLKSEKFGEVCLPERLVHIPYTRDLRVTKVNESLALLEYYNEVNMSVCDVWMRKDGANNPFTKIYTIKVEAKWLSNWVLGFRNNGEVVIKLNNDKESKIALYEPLSGHINDVGISGKRGSLSARSYMETLLLLDEADSVIL